MAWRAKALKLIRELCGGQSAPARMSDEALLAEWRRLSDEAERRLSADNAEQDAR